MPKEIVEVKSSDCLKDLYNHSAMTWEGLREEDFQLALAECGTQDAIGYVTKGKVMNQICHLTGSNAYPDDLNIFSVMPSKGLAILVGARWMDDIVDNNAHRQGYHPFIILQYDEEE